MALVCGLFMNSVVSLTQVLMPKQQMEGAHLSTAEHSDRRNQLGIDRYVHRTSWTLHCQLDNAVADRLAAAALVELDDLDTALHDASAEQG